MNFTAGLLLLLFNIFIPGLLFLRFYYTGDFAKQFTTKIPLFRLGFYALIPGIILKIIFLGLYNLYDEEFVISGALEVFHDLMGHPKDYSVTTNFFFEKQIKDYTYFTLIQNLFAIFFGWLFHALVMYFNLDLRLNILKFKNDWYYIFSGDILKSKKYSKKLLTNIYSTLKFDSGKRGVMLSYADILVNESGTPKIYSGIVANYEISQNDANELEKIMLVDAHKRDILENGKITKTPIPGDIFVILNSNIQNINLTYVPSVTKKVIPKKKRKERNTDKIIKSLLLLFFYISLSLFIKPISIYPISFLTENLNIFQKLYTIFVLLLLLSLLVPTNNEETQKPEDKRALIYGVSFIVIIEVLMLLYEFFL